jgi:uncharacterized protein YkwD
MLQKFWKTLKFFIILGIVLFIIPKSILPRQSSDVKMDDLEYYIKLNDTELRLPEYRDDEESLKLKLAQLEIINKSRKRYNAGPVKLDILASRIANEISREAAKNNYIGHYDLAGEKPYQRYAFAGGHDHVSENAFGEWTSGSYTISNSVILLMMQKGHNTFMEERSPYDGHKKNIINKSHDFVGLGFYISGNQFRYYEEFIDRAFDFRDIPERAFPGKPVKITLDTDSKSYLYYLIAYRDDFPVPMTPEQINRKGSYQDFTGEQYLTLPAWELSRFRNGNEYNIPLEFSGEGLYYIQIFTDNKEMTSPSSINTSGKTPFSGIVIRIQD